MGLYFNCHIFFTYRIAKNFTLQHVKICCCNHKDQVSDQKLQLIELEKSLGSKSTGNKKISLLKSIALWESLTALSKVQNFIGTH
jgi:hypothetical protein